MCGNNRIAIRMNGAFYVLFRGTNSFLAALSGNFYSKLNALEAGSAVRAMVKCFN